MTKSSPNTRLSKALESPLPLSVPSLPSAFEDLQISVDRFCLLAGVEALGEMLAEEAGRPGPEAEALCGPRHARSAERRAHRWGTADSALAWQGGKIKVTRPRVRDLSGKEMKLASWQALSDPDLLRAWAMKLILRPHRQCLAEGASAHRNAQALLSRSRRHNRLPHLPKLGRTHPNRNRWRTTT